MIAFVECDDCGTRMPMREAFSPEEVLGRWGVYELLVGEGRCTCGGTLREDPSSSLAALQEAVWGNPD